MADQELRAGGGSPALHDSAIVSQSPSAHGVAGPVSHTQWITGCAIRVITLSGEVRSPPTFQPLLPLPLPSLALHHLRINSDVTPTPTHPGSPPRSACRLRLTPLVTPSCSTNQPKERGGGWVCEVVQRRTFSHLSAPHQPLHSIHTQRTTLTFVHLLPPTRIPLLFSGG